ncbi:MAG: carboxypeptidase regulatory-like domain-containing protein [Chitinophaga sp.]|uniref:carboxypeptidase-like regulatory domain-containing protein n=1 Tax=Chitinophaga sp. TaxID=1869181 RepID=UPI001B18F55A|nr:carboxypeptidase-like regulatory domain-containing protein [Chitinophaga sp.]MBO9729233.1 carboxypeptidase regulatory-like domain-containing protein [Chitinophaga sp.]
MKTAFLCLAILTLTSCSKPARDPGDPGGDGPITWGPQPALPVVNGTATFNLSATDDHVNVMGNTIPGMPVFPTIKVQPKKLRGFVADLSGKPLKGAYIGIRATIDGGFYSGASAETDEKGYYEIALPSGAIHFYAAGFTINYSNTMTAVGLYAADGKADDFAYQNGAVENFVLLSYGVASAQQAQQMPRDEANYFGGSLSLSYAIFDPTDILHSPGELPQNAEIAVTLVPDGMMLYGEAKTFSINKKVGNTSFSVNNIPVGRYKMTARLKDGRQLRLKAIGPQANLFPFLGLQPREVAGNATVLFTPLFHSQQSTVLAHTGNWRNVEIKFELP